MDDPSLRKVVVQVTDISMPWRSVFRLTAKFMIAAALIYSAFFLTMMLIAKIVVPYLQQGRIERGDVRAPVIEIGAAPQSAPAECYLPGTQDLFAFGAANSRLTSSRYTTAASDFAPPSDFDFARRD